MRGTAVCCCGVSAGSSAALYGQVLARPERRTLWRLGRLSRLYQPALGSRRCSHSNLQALREIDARLLFSSPEISLLGTSVESSGTGTAYVAPGSRSAGNASSCQATSGRYGAGPFRASTPLSCQMGFPVA